LNGANLVVGGAGYIGSHMANILVQGGHSVIVLDNLCTGFQDAVHYGRLVEGDLADSTLLDQIFTENDVAAVLHFAALSQVGESMREPARYYRNNVASTQNLLDAMLRHGVKRFIFSSTAAKFGEPETPLIDEQHPKRPINPYGRSKRMVEEMLADYDQAYGLRSVCLRYFNAAGADPEGELGGTPRSGKPPDSPGPVSGQRPTRSHCRVRERLPHPRWNLHSGLHSCLGSLQRLSAGRWRERHFQPG
jgi:UDP-glucose 4-epimerase